MKVEEVNLNRIIFIIGVGRSGTTLLMSTLNAHSRICFPPETMFLKHYLCRPKVHKIFAKDKRRFFNLLNKDSNFKRLGMKAENIIESLNNEFSLKEYYQTMLGKYASAKNKILVGDKYPRNLELLPEIKYLFPDAIIIHIIRDPRDVILSRMKTWWGVRRNLIAHIGITREMLKLASEQGRKLFNKNYYELRYEDLLKNPEDKLQDICNLLEINYEPNMLNFQKSASEIIQKDELSFKARNLESLIRNNTNKWKKEMNKFKVILIESGCRSNMKKYNYSLKYDLLSIIFMPINTIYILFRIIFRIHQKIRFFKLSKYSSFS
ncbi:MAG: sulfotransferase family protein [Candidatus Helarchaeota archaeon]